MKRESIAQICLGVVGLGCLWGLFEAVTFLGLLHSHWGILFSFHICPCFLMSAIFGSFVLGMALAVYRKPAVLIGVGLAAAAFCFLSVPFLPVVSRSTPYGPAISSATAAFIGAISLTLVARLLMKKLETSTPVRIGAGALYGLLAATLFILATTYGLDKPICADLGYARPLPDFLGIGGMLWMVSAAILFPSGYLAGAKLRFWLNSKLTLRVSSSYYYAPAVITLVCCGLGAAAFAAGL